MNKFGWDVSHLEEFQNATKAYYQKLKTCATSRPPTISPERFLFEVGALKEFVHQAKLLQDGHSNPRDLPYAYDDEGKIPNYRILEISSWCGYYRVNAKLKRFTGILAFHRDHAPEGLRNALETAAALQQT